LLLNTSMKRVGNVQKVTETGIVITIARRTLARTASPSSAYASAPNRWETKAMVPPATPPPSANASPQ